MHPAFSVIFFTTASGAGYGLLVGLGLVALLSVSPYGASHFVGAGVLALTLISGGLLASTFHLGHPERAWRALSQWRTSWLSREGICALATFIPACIFVFGPLLNGVDRRIVVVAGALSGVLALVTVFTTSMIYASLRSIDAWCNHWVPKNYLLLSLTTGFVLLNAWLTVFGVASNLFLLLTVGFLLLSLFSKIACWCFIDAADPTSTAGTAIGMERNAKVALTQAPHSETNYLQQEMGYEIARKHAQKLRRIAIICAFIAPALLTAVPLLTDNPLARFGLILAVPVIGVGILIERWLFFAEAKHTVSLYYTT